MSENLFVACAPFILISRNYLNYHTVPQIIFGSTIGFIFAVVFFWTIGRKLDEGRLTGTFFDKIVVAAEKTGSLIDTIADVTGVESLPAKDSQTKQELTPQKNFPLNTKDGHTPQE